MSNQFDLIIVGAGILGAATAWRYLQAFPQHRVLILEKEPGCALHQTGRNSGVIHAGVYYAPGSLKAQYCRQGLESTVEFCQQYQLPYEQCGKLIVATDEKEQVGLESLYKNCLHNNLNPVRLSAKQLAQKEPNINGQEAIWVNQTGITDYQKITQTMLALARDSGAEVKYGKEVTQIDERGDDIRVSVTGSTYQAALLVNCAGLYADRVVSMQGLSTDYQIIPFRGEYYRLPAHLNNVVDRLIYPVPDPALPFLGVHLTKMIDGSVTVGPNAVLALAREGYSWSRINRKDIMEMAKFSGFLPLIKRYFSSGISEFKDSCFKSGYLSRVQKYCPQIQLSDLQPYPSGVRAQAVTKEGKLLHDFKFIESARSIHIGNAPSPAATSAIPIADAILSKIKGVKTGTSYL